MTKFYDINITASNTMTAKEGRGQEVKDQMLLRSSKIFCQCSLNDLERKTISVANVSKLLFQKGNLYQRKYISKSNKKVERVSQLQKSLN